MNYLAAESCRNSECSAVDNSAGSGSCKRAGMANSTTNLREERVASSGGGRNWLLTTRSARRCHEIGKRKHVISIILRIRYGIKSGRESDVDDALSSAGWIFVCSGIRGAGAAAAETIERISDTHLVEISIAGERNQACMLCFPAKTADAQLITGFRYRNLGQRAALGQWLCSDIILQRRVGETLDESIAKRAERDSESLDCFRSRDMFDDVRIRRSCVNKLSPRCVYESAVGQVPSPEFHLLSKCSDVNRLVTFDASDVVIGGTKTVFDCFTFREDKLVVFESAIASRRGRYRIRHALVDRRALDTKAVKKVIGFGIHIGGECFGSCLTFDSLRGTQGHDERRRKQD